MATRREVKKTASKGRESSRSSKAEKGKSAVLKRSRTKSDTTKAHKQATKGTPGSPAKLVPVPFPGGFRPQKGQEMNERSAHLEKLKQLFESAPIGRFLGMSLGYCENGVARVRLPFRKEFEEGHGIIHGGLIGLLADTAGSFAVGSMSPGSTVKTVEFKMSLLAGVQGDLLAIGEVVRKGRTLATCRLEVVEGNDRVVAIGLATYALQAV
jgi:uncharacterized protein (TIGR00369 family)